MSNDYFISPTLHLTIITKRKVMLTDDPRVRLLQL